MCFCFVLGYVCELFTELVGFLFGCYCSVVFEGYCVVCYGCWFFVGYDEYMDMRDGYDLQRLHRKLSVGMTFSAFIIGFLWV